MRLSLEISSGNVPKLVSYRFVRLLNSSISLVCLPVVSAMSGSAPYVLQYLVCFLNRYLFLQNRISAYPVLDASFWRRDSRLPKVLPGARRRKLTRSLATEILLMDSGLGCVLADSKGRMDL